MQEPYTPDDLLVARVDRWSNWLLIVVVLIPFIVSFGALKDLAAKNGINYPFMYPLMIDLSLIIFNLVALRSSLFGERNRYAWTLVIVATVISVILNVVHAPPVPLSMFMAGLPPLFILAAFHLVVMRIEQSAKRSRATMTLAHLKKEIEAAQTQREQLNSQKEQITREYDTQREQLAAIREQVATAQDELEKLRREQSRLKREQSNEPSAEAAITARREKIKLLLNGSSNQMTQAELAQALGVSISTIRRDLQSMNGQVTG